MCKSLMRKECEGALGGTVRVREHWSEDFPAAEAPAAAHHPGGAEMSFLAPGP